MKIYPCARYNIHKTAETEFDFIEVGKDIGVVKLDVVDDDGLRKVMKEFGALVEKGGVVFVSFENEILRIAKGCALAPDLWRFRRSKNQGRSQLREKSR